MSRARMLWHLLRADFLERVRRYSFLVTLAATVWLGYAVGSGKLELWIGTVRGVYNSAWIATTMALVINTFLSLAGFYVVKSSVERDRQTGVGQILATTPMSKPLYTLGKTASNLAVLAAMVGVLVIASVVAQLGVGEDTQIHLLELLKPFVLLCLPMMAFVAASAVLFETIPGLRGGFGNVVWFFVWMACIPAGMQAGKLLDPVGIGFVNDDLKQAAAAVYGPADRGFILGGIDRDSPTQTMRWDGLDWTAEALLARLAWVLAAVGIAFVAALFFDRFDPARSWLRSRQARKGKGSANGAAEEAPAFVPVPAVHLTPLSEASRRFRFLGVLQAELRLLLKGQRWWWWAGAAGFWIATLTAPLEAVQQIVLPLAWLWPLLLWSSLGSREIRWDTTALLFSAARPLGRQLPATWLAGVALAVLTGGGAALRFLATGRMDSLGAWAVAVLFIPTLALALGIWSGSGKLFEVIYLVLWYIGPMNRVPAMDYAGATPAGLASGMPLVFLGMTALLMVAAVAGRRRQLAG